MWFPERRRVALLLDVARHHDAGRLADAMTTLRWVVDWAPQPLPTRLTDLVAMCDRLVPVVAPPADRPTPATSAAEAESAAEAARRPGHTADLGTAVDGGRLRPTTRASSANRVGERGRHLWLHRPRRRACPHVGPFPSRCSPSVNIEAETSRSACRRLAPSWAGGHGNSTTVSTPSRARLPMDTRG